MHAAKWDTYVCCISSLWQPLTYFLPRVLPYNSGANITTYGRKSGDRKGRPGRRNVGNERKGERTEIEMTGNRNGNGNENAREKEMENGEERGKSGRERERETLILREKAGCSRVERKKRVDSFVFIE